LGTSFFVLITGVLAIFKFIAIPFEGTFGEFLQPFLIWLVGSCIVGWFIEEKMRNDDVETGSFFMDALLWLNVLNYKMINQIFRRRHNQESSR
jgi:hypothetical protein